MYSTWSCPRCSHSPSLVRSSSSGAGCTSSTTIDAVLLGEPENFRPENFSTENENKNENGVFSLKITNPGCWPESPFYLSKARAVTKLGRRPMPSKQRCSHGYPVRRPPTRRRPRRTPPSAPPARPPSARPCAPSRPSSSWPTCTRCPWKTPTSTQRLPCLPPSLPPGCSLPDDLLEEDGFDGGLMLGACVRTSQRVR